MTQKGKQAGFDATIDAPMEISIMFAIENGVHAELACFGTLPSLSKMRPLKAGEKKFVFGEATCREQSENGVHAELACFGTPFSLMKRSEGTGSC